MESGPDLSSLEDSSVFGWVDWVSIILYFLLLCIIAVKVAKTQTEHIKSGQSKHETEAYFLAEKSVPWWAVGASLFASNIGTEHFIGLAGNSAREGISVGFFEIGAIPCVLFLGFFFLPVYMNSQLMTSPDYLSRRYNKTCRSILVCLSLILYVFTKVSVTLYAGQLILGELSNFNGLISILVLVVGTAVYTVMGGLGAVVYTEALQTVVLIVGGFVVLGFALSHTGSIDELRIHFKNQNDRQYFHLFRPADDPDYPWTGFIFGFYSVAPWYWGIDQVIVQRAMAAKDILHGQYGAVVAAFLKTLPFFLMVLPGVSARVLLERAHFPGVEADEFDFDRSYPFLVRTVVPMNFRGIIVASMLASLMSSLASVFNSSATLFSINIWKEWYPNTSEQVLVWIGRATVVVIAVFSLLWLPIIPALGKSLFLAAQKPAAYTAAPVLATYIWGMLSRFPSAIAGQCTLAIGILLGITRFTLETIEIVSEQSGRFGRFTSINFMHFACLNLLFSSLILFLLSCVFKRDFTKEDVRLYSHAGLSSKLYMEQHLISEKEHAKLRQRSISTGGSESDFAANVARLVSDELNGGQNGITEMQLHDVHDRIRNGSCHDSVDSDLEENWDVFDLQPDIELKRSSYGKQRFVLHVFTVIVLFIWSVLLITFR